MTTQTITNIGAGTMGHAIALQFALHGDMVRVLDTSAEALERGRRLIEQALQALAVENPAAVWERLRFTTDAATALSGADFVIESIVEDLTVKKTLWQQVEPLVAESTILATNTSGLSPTALQADLQHPERFVVAHFWNPATLMPLVEVVPGEKTSPAAVAQTVAVMQAIGKHAVALDREAPGFVGNRIQMAVLREALHIVEAGIASPEAVDAIVKDCLGRRWNLVGPLASADLGGLDVFANISRYLYADLAGDTGVDPTLAKMVAAGHLGQKSGQGFYDWQGATGQRVVAGRDQALLAQLQADEQ